jgi:hypothetical protein
MQEAFNMKRIVGLILVFCLVFSLFAEALAAPKWEIVQQTKCETNEKKKTVSLSVKVKGKGIKYQWVFVNPEDPEDKVTGKNLSKDKRFKGIKVKDFTKSKIILSKVPEALHGWYAYCHLYSNAYKLDTDMVAVQLPGMDPAPEPEKPAAAEGEGEAGAEGETGTEAGTEGEAAATKEESKDKDTAKDTKKADENAEEVGDDDEGIAAAEEPKEFTVTANGKYLFKADSMGNPESDEGVSSLTFTGTGNVAVKSDDPIKSWTVNGVRIEPEEEMSTFKLLNLSADTTVNVKTAIKTAASAKVDESTTFTVTCDGCSFTYMPKGLKSAKEGEVPSGAVIYVFADKSESAANGYSVNGGEPENLGASSMQLTITGDTSIAVK